MVLCLIKNGGNGNDCAVSNGDDYYSFRIGKTTASKARSLFAAEKATEYLKENAAQYGLKADLSDLQYISTTETSVASYVRFQQVVNGAPVFSKQITVTLNGEGKGVLAVSDYQSVKGVKEATTKISEKDAIQKSMAYVGEVSEQNLWAPTEKEFDILLKRELLVQYIKL